MRRTCKGLAFAVLLLLTSEAWAAIQSPLPLWSLTPPGYGVSLYYFNDNVVNGNVLGGALGIGPFEQDKTGAIVNSTSAAGVAAKSAVRLGDYVYFSDKGATGSNIYRTQVANTPTPWSTYETIPVPSLPGNEPPISLVTDGVHIFSSTVPPTSALGAGIQCYSVNAATGALTQDWTTFIPGSIRGLDYDASGYLYAVNGGRPAAGGSAVGNTATMYAINASTGTATAMGGSITFNGELYQTIREGNQIITFDSYGGSAAPAGQMYVYNLTNNTTLASSTPVLTCDPAGIDKIYGAAVDDSGFMWLSGSGQTAGYQIAYVPGDANLDRTTDATDLNTVLSFYNQTGTNWAKGDFNGDGITDATDLNTVLSYYNQSLGAIGGSLQTSSVPEPSSIVMLTTLSALVGAWVIRRRSH